MKKIFLILILMFVFVNVKAEEVNLKLEWIPNVYYNYEKDGLTYWGQLAYIYVDDKIAYCLNIEDTISTFKYNPSDSKFDNELVTKAGYFGYGYNNEKTLEDYMATQQLIWRYLGWDVYYTTKSNGLGKRISVDDKLLEINDRAGRYSLFPDFEGNFNLEIGEKSYIKDKNGVINNLEIVNETNNKVYIDNNNVIIEASEIGNHSFTLETKYQKNYDNVVYEAPNSQKIVVIGEVDKLFNSYLYNVDGGIININILKNVDIGLEDDKNIIELYKDNQLIDTYTITDNLNINNLGFGNYSIKIIKVAEGYSFTDNLIEFTLSKDNNIVNKTIDLKAIEIDLSISKKYGNKKYNLIKSDDNVHYDIYDNSNNLIDIIVTDENGECSKKLYYGNYVIKQKDINNVDIYHEDIIITKDNFIDTKVDLFDEVNRVNLRLIGKNIEELVNYSFEFNDSNYNSIDAIYTIRDLDFGSYNINNIEALGYNSIDTINLELNNDLDYYVLDDNLYYDYTINFEKVVTEKEKDPEEISSGVDENDKEVIEIVDNGKDNDITEKEKDSEEISSDVDENDKKVIEIVDNSKNNDNTEKEKDSEKISSGIDENDKEVIEIVDNGKDIDNFTNVKKLPNLGVYNVFYKENYIIFKYSVFDRM